MAYSITTATIRTGIPPQTIRNLEKRGVIGPLARDHYGRRVLTDADLDALRVYAAQRDGMREAA